MKSLKNYIIDESLLDDEDDLVNSSIGKVYHIYKHVFSKFPYIDVYNQDWKDMISLKKLNDICDSLQYKFENDEVNEPIYPIRVKDKQIRINIINMFINLAVDEINIQNISKEFNKIAEDKYNIDFFKTNRFLKITIFQQQDKPLIEIGFEKRKPHELLK